MTLNLLNSLSNDHNYIHESGEFSDTEILVGEEPNTRVFKAHALILKTRSPYFRTALSSNWIKIENDIIKFQKPNISVEIFDILLKYIYCSIIDLTTYDVRTIVAILIAADELCINNLCDHIENHLINDEYSLKCNFVLVQKIANQLPQFTGLLQFYKLNVHLDPSLILRANDFITIQEDTLLNFLTEHGQCLLQIEVWDKLVDWAIARSNEIPSETKFGSIIQPFISHVNFKLMSLTDFCQKVKPLKNIFDDDLYVEILEHYSFTEEVHSKFKMDINSEIINSDHAFLLGNLIKITKQDNCNSFYDFQLLVRGSRDGFDVKTFHRFCDDKGPTITIARVNNTDEMIGGFSPIDWSPKYDGDAKESFIFSLDKNNLSNFTFSKVIRKKFAINKMLGPAFGYKKSDLRLLEGDGKRGHCYKNNYEKLIRKNEGTFEINDYEVFKVIDVEKPSTEFEPETPPLTDMRNPNRRGGREVPDAWADEQNTLTDWDVDRSNWDESPSLWRQVHTYSE